MVTEYKSSKKISLSIAIKKKNLRKRSKKVDVRK
jgi:hypothetical protein